MATSNPTETRIASVFKDENGFLIITMKDCGIVDEFDVLDLHIVLRYKTERKPAIKLLDARANWNMDKKAKIRARMEDTMNTTIARAIVVSSNTKLLLVKFLQSFKKQNYPQEIFTNKEKAYEWLITFKTE